MRGSKAKILDGKLMVNNGDGWNVCAVLPKEYKIEFDGENFLIEVKKDTFLAVPFSDFESEESAARLEKNSEGDQSGLSPSLVVFEEHDVLWEIEGEVVFCEDEGCYDLKPSDHREANLSRILEIHKGDRLKITIEFAKEGDK